MSKCARPNTGIFPVEDYRPVYLPFSLLLYFAEFKLYVFHNQHNVEVMTLNIINSEINLSISSNCVLTVINASVAVTLLEQRPEN